MSSPRKTRSTQRRCALRYAHDKLELKPPFTAAPELAPRHDRYYLV
jgi:hypothetical protein